MTYTLNWTEAQLDDALTVAREQWEAAVASSGGATAAQETLREEAIRAFDSGDRTYHRVLSAAREYGDTGTLTTETAESTARSVCVRGGCANLRSQAGDAECFEHHYEPWGRAYQDELRDRR